MITKDELKKLSVLGELADIEVEMRKAASRGSFAIRISRYIEESVKEKLREFGYSVGNDEGDTIISWDE